MINIMYETIKTGAFSEAPVFIFILISRSYLLNVKAPSQRSNQKQAVEYYSE
jgi:hypothetical protein